ncbi:hypothetical protein [Flammeovirga aprica]|uniref:Uncharacterized protein n=1 Tax=Flammeovirga aprica JL-4 TaxID=694437 RepID=A0A7X9P3J1_9BACT|nr:hypothetical protein [Flammeovirga aprica]NME68720.1 hypothetical protein [Flammeovirga aprica JL-4]
MKFFYTSLLFLLASLSVVGQQLPSTLWDNASTYSYMYYPKTLDQTSTFHIQTNHHFLAFNYKNVHLEKLDFFTNPMNIQEAHHQNLPEASFKKDQDLLGLYLVYDGVKYKVVTGADIATNNELIESGQFFHRRYITGLALEDGPDFPFSLEIASWNDVISFEFEFTGNQVPEDEMELVLELELPQKEVKSTKLISKQVNIQTKAGKKLRLLSATENGAVTFKKNKFSVSAPISGRKVSATLITANTENEVHQLQFSAKEKTSPFSDLEIKEDPLHQSTVVSINDNIEGLDGMERIDLSFKNNSAKTVFRRLVFEKTDAVQNITGVSILLRDNDGNPLGIPVQISKNWHMEPAKFNGPWLRAYTKIAIPPKSEVNIEFTRVSGFWGSLPAASHSQLSLVGWPSAQTKNNQLWEQSAIGAFGESICYEPDGGQASTMMTDVRPLMIQSTIEGVANPKVWNWTGNVGGGDFMRVYDMDGKKQQIANIKTRHKRLSPNMTEVVYAGVTEGGEASYELMTSIYRTDDYNRGTYTLKIKVDKPLQFSRLALVQVGSETYAYSTEKMFAYGNEKGLIKEMENQWEDKKYLQKEIKIEGETPWLSMHQAVNPVAKQWGSWANKGLVLRDWKAVIGGKEVAPRFSTYGIHRGRVNSNLMEINLPSDIKTLQAGDSIEFTVVMCIIPQEAESYYGPNQAFKAFLEEAEDTWKPIFREAQQNNLELEVSNGKVIRKCPLKIEVEDESKALEVNFKSGVGYIPMTVAGLKSYKDLKLVLKRNGNPIQLEQEKHGNDYWQTDFEPTSKTWELTYSIPLDVTLQP